MTVPFTAPPAVSPESDRPRLTVLVVADDRQYLDRIEAVFSDDDRFEIRTMDSFRSALPRLEAVDCFVVERGIASGDIDTLLGRITRRATELPIVLLTDGRPSAVADAVRSHQWVDSLPRRETAAGIERLGRRVRELVERRRLAALSTRLLAGIELAQDAIAIVDPDGDIELANRSYAMRFGYDPDALVGVRWQTLFTDATVDHLESTAIPTVADGWRWTGICTGSRRTGETFTARVRLGGLEDGSLVFIVDESDDHTEKGDGDSAA